MYKMGKKWLYEREVKQHHYNLRALFNLIIKWDKGIRIKSVLENSLSYVQPVFEERKKN